MQNAKCKMQCPFIRALRWGSFTRHAFCIVHSALRIRPFQ
jgi:hypothetical protein